MKRFIGECLILLVLFVNHCFAEEVYNTAPSFPIKVEFEFPLEKKYETGDIVEIKVTIIPDFINWGGEKFYGEKKYEVHSYANGRSNPVREGTLECLSNPDSIVSINYHSKVKSLIMRYRVKKEIEYITACSAIYEVIDPDSPLGKLCQNKRLFPWQQNKADFWRYRDLCITRTKDSKTYSMKKKKEERKYPSKTPDVHIMPTEYPVIDYEKNDIWKID